MPTERELIGLLARPNETMTVEHKGWLDIGVNREKAILAKAAIAIANEGGGIIVIGMRDNAADQDLQSQERPAEIPRYNQDDVVAAINRFVDPPLECRLYFSNHPDTGVEHAFITVPGGHTVPVMSRRAAEGVMDCPRCYIRKPGPRSEEPFTAVEWRTLFERCVRNGREDLLDAIRLIVEGRAGAQVDAAAAEALLEYVNESRARLEELVATLPADDDARFPHGAYEVAFKIEGLADEPSLVALRDRLRATSELRYTGWPAFISMTRPEFAPRASQGAIEAWLGQPVEDRFRRDAAHCDYWRVQPDHQFFQIRGYDEDSHERFEPGSAFDVVLPLWRVGETMLFASRYASRNGDNPEIDFRLRYVGLENRVLTSVNRLRVMHDDRRCNDDEIALSVRASAEEIENNLPELLRGLLAPLYEMFDFFELSPQMVTDEVNRMREGRF